MSKLFDDESDEEYTAKAPEETNPVAQQQEQQQQHSEPVTQQQDQYYQQQEQPKQQEEEEYNPYSGGQSTQPEQEYNPYVESVPVVQQENTPVTSYVSPTPSIQQQDQTGAKATHNLADQRLRDAANTAKNTLLSQINNFNQVSEQSGVANQAGFEDEENNSHLFGVTNPVKVGSVVKYTVTGQDSDGKFEVQRRYNDFHILHVTLCERWPGCFIPCIPEKQILGDKEDGFIEERRSLLNRFIFECSKFEFIIGSKEFKIFARQPGDVGDTLEKLPKELPKQILEKYRRCFQLDEQQDNSEVARYREKINQFNTFLCKAILGMNKDRLMLNNAAQQYTKSFDHYKGIYGQFMQYEDCAMDFFNDNDGNSVRILTSPAVGDMKQKIDDTVKCYKSPFAESALWIKGEMLDIQGMIDALKGRETVMKKQMAAESKRRDDQEELEKLSLGKTTLKSFFKSKSGKEADILALQAKIEGANVDIEEYRKLINFITIFHGQMAIDKFKKQKMQQYRLMLQSMSTRSINNSYLTATLNSGILQVFEQM